jgi:hypothetical protein
LPSPTVARLGADAVEFAAEAIHVGADLVKGIRAGVGAFEAVDAGLEGAEIELQVAEGAEDIAEGLVLLAGAGIGTAVEGLHLAFKAVDAGIEGGGGGEEGGGDGSGVPPDQLFQALDAGGELPDPHIARVFGGGSIVGRGDGIRQAKQRAQKGESKSNHGSFTIPRMAHNARGFAPGAGDVNSDQ